MKEEHIPTLLDTIRIDPHGLQFWRKRKNTWRHYLVDTDKDLLYIDGFLKNEQD